MANSTPIVDRLSASNSLRTNRESTVGRGGRDDERFSYYIRKAFFRNWIIHTVSSLPFAAKKKKRSARSPESKSKGEELTTSRHLSRQPGESEVRTNDGALQQWHSRGRWAGRTRRKMRRIVNHLEEMVVVVSVGHGERIQKEELGRTWCFAQSFLCIQPY